MKNAFWHTFRTPLAALPHLPPPTALSLGQLPFSFWPWHVDKWHLRRQCEFYKFSQLSRPLRASFREQMMVWKARKTRKNQKTGQNKTLTPAAISPNESAFGVGCWGRWDSVVKLWVAVVFRRLDSCIFLWHFCGLSTSGQTHALEPIHVTFATNQFHMLHSSPPPLSHYLHCQQAVAGFSQLFHYASWLAVDFPQFFSRI